MLEKLVRIGYLFDFYGPLLTERQQDFIRLYYHHDLSLSEIAERYQITRQSVYDTLKRSEESLENYEKNLKIYRRMEKMKDRIDELEAILDQNACLSSVSDKKTPVSLKERTRLTKRFRAKLKELKMITSGELRE